MTDDVTVGVGLSRLVKADELLRERAFNRSVVLSVRRGSRGYRPIRVLEPEKKSTRLDQTRGQAHDQRAYSNHHSIVPLTSYTLPACAIVK